MMTPTRNLKAMGIAITLGLLLAVTVLSTAKADAAVVSGQAYGWGDNFLGHYQKAAGRA